MATAEIENVKHKMSLMASIRYWLIKKLAGESMIAINLKVVRSGDGEAPIKVIDHYAGALVIGCHFEGGGIEQLQGQD